MAKTALPTPPTPSPSPLPEIAGLNGATAALVDHLAGILSPLRRDRVEAHAILASEALTRSPEAVRNGVAEFDLAVRERRIKASPRILSGFIGQAQRKIDTRPAVAPKMRLTNVQPVGFISKLAEEGRLEEFQEWWEREGMAQSEAYQRKADEEERRLRAQRLAEVDR